MARQAPLGGKHAVITGASRGIGTAIAALLVKHGARVSLLGRQTDSLARAAQQLGDGAETCVATADVADTAQVHAAFGHFRAAFGPIHILINNAGQAASAPLHKTADELWQRMLAVNLTGTFHCSRAALPDMLAQKFGRIVNVASVAGLAGAAYITAYCAAKHGVIGFTRALALEVAERNITVNAVCPGYTDTDMVRDAVQNIRKLTGRGDEEALAMLTARNPQRRLIQPVEVANAVSWLCLPGSEAITGQSISVAGGEVT